MVFPSIPLPDLGGDAACRGQLWIVDASYERPGGDDAKDMARLLCGHCEVRAACLEHAVTHHEPGGVWGGMTPNARTRLRHGQEP